MAMKSYAKSDNVAILWKRAIDVFAESYMINCLLRQQFHLLNLNGFKRKHRCLSKRDNMFRVKLQDYAIDIFGADLSPSWNYHVSKPKTIEDCMELDLTWKIESYTKLNEIINDLTKEGYRSEAKMLTSYLPKISKGIKKIRRYIDDYEKSGRSWHHVTRLDNKLDSKYKK